MKMEKDNLTITYLEYYEKYSKLYENVVIFMQCGGFYELYSYDTQIFDIYKIADILNIVVTRKSKAILEVSNKNPLMAGFPLVSLSKYINILTDNNYNVVVIEQTTQPPNPKREVTQIISSGTNINNISCYDTNNLVSLYIESTVQKCGKQLVCIGISSIDLSTGECYIHEAYSSLIDDNYSIDEAIRFINFTNPKELIIYNLSHIDKHKIYSSFENKNIRYYDKIDKQYIKISYQNELLKNSYSDIGMLSPLEYLEMDRMPYCTISFVLLINYGYQHNNLLIKNINKPKNFQSNNKLIYGNNATLQLNVMNNGQSNGKIKCLLDVINKGTTAMGKRYIKSRILSPYTDITILNKIYDDVEKIKNYYGDIEIYLKKISDIERLYRKMIIGSIQPQEFANIIISIQQIININNILKDSKIYNINYIDKIYSFVDEYTKIFNMDELNKGFSADNFYNVGIRQKIDDILNDITKSDKFMDEFNDYVYETTNLKFYIKYSDKEGNYLIGTKNKINEFKKKIMTRQTIDFGRYNLSTDKITFKELKDTTKIYVDIDISNDICELKEQLQITLTTYFKMDMENVYKKYDKLFIDVIKYISYIDYIKTICKCAELYNYCRPVLVKNDYSYVNAIDSRHPIIERIIDVEYIPNNIDNLGKNGILLYGYNGVGKSSYMKMVGLNIIMAQSGFFVPAKYFELSPYKSLYTRISKGDNIFQNISSFGQEMIELRAILQRSNTEFSLILGDEIAQSTEIISATSIMATTIIHLINSNSTFIFATHLHDIIKINKIKELDKLKIMHLTVNYCPEKDLIIYDRKLKNGCGEIDYGLSVSQYFLKNSDFMKKAIEIKNELLNKPYDVIPYKKSRYNKTVLVYKCYLCGETNNTNNNDNFIHSLHSHHINYRIECENGFYNHIQENSNINIAILCNKCHNDIHKKNIKLRYMNTSDGKKLMKI